MDEIPGFDLYRTLKVTRDAPNEVIAAAHRTLVRGQHPDVRPGPRAIEETKRLNIARDWLTDPSRRARYDLARAHRPVPQPARRWPRTDGPAPSEAPSRYQSDLLLWVMRCDRMTNSEVRGLARMFRRTIDERPGFAMAAAELVGLAETLGRSGAAQQAFTDAISTNGSIRRWADAPLIHAMRWTACAIAVSDAHPLLARTVVVPWQEVLDRSDLAAAHRQRLRRMARRIAGRTLTVGLVGVTAVLALAGLVSLVAMLSGWSGV